MSFTDRRRDGGGGTEMEGKYIPQGINFIAFIVHISITFRHFKLQHLVDF